MEPDYHELWLHLMLIHHYSPEAGYLGWSNTLELVQREYYWQGMQTDMDRSLRNCHTCNRTQTAQHTPFRVLRPLPIPKRRWDDILMDFKKGLPSSNRCNTILVVANRRIKMRYMIRCRKDTDIQKLAWLFIRYVQCQLRASLTGISDQGPQFVSEL